MKVYMFPGQGSQYRGMGAELFDRFPLLAGQADGILGYSVRELCLDDPQGRLGNTRFTQPALYVVNALAFAARREDGGQAPDFVVGHSLGEFNALQAAGCFDFETGLRLVQRRGELMAAVSSGGMAAVVNASRETILQALADHGLANLHLANYNSPSQIVLAGPLDELGQAELLFQDGTMRFYPLATSGAFHSPAMRGAMEQFRACLQDVGFAPPRIPVVANVTARPYQPGAILETLASQIASTVRWCESIQYLMAVAASRGEEADFEELSQGDVLTKMAWTIRMQTPPEVLERLGAELVPAQPAAPASAPEKVAAWNRRHAVGSKVRSTVVEDPDLETRTEALVLFGHRAAVYLKGYKGYFDLDELTPA